MDNQNFFKDHIDTFAIIGTQVATTAIFIGIILSMISQVNSRQDIMNSRMDTVQMLIYQEMKDYHGRLTFLENKKTLINDIMKRP